MSGAGDLKRAAQRAVELAIGAGAESAEAYCQDEREVEIRVYDRAVESLTEAGSQGVGIRVFGSGGRSGHAYGTTFDDAGLKALTERALDIALASDEDEHAGLPDECGEADAGALVAEDFASWDTAAKVDLAIAVENAARGADPRVSQVEQTIYADGHGRVAIANSAGFIGEYESTAAYAYSSAFAGEGDDLMTGLGLGLGRSPSELDPDAIGAEAAQRAIELLGARGTTNRRAPVVLDAFVAASFMGLVAGALSGEAVLRGRSPFIDKLGEDIAAGMLTVTDDGLAPGGPSSAPFDGEGVAQRRTPLFEGGTLINYLYDARTAREAEAVDTGNGRRGSYRGRPHPAPTNIVIEPGESTLEELIAQAGDGLYVTNVVGLHSGVNPVSGVFSVGASGIEIRDGKLGAPVREATIASDLASMLGAVVAVGDNPRWIPFGGSVHAVPLLVGEMSIAGE